MKVQAGKEMIEAVTSGDDNYPGIKLMLGGEEQGDLAVILENNIVDNKLQILVYTENNEEPVIINYKTGAITVPEGWRIDV